MARKIQQDESKKPGNWVQEQTEAEIQASMEACYEEGRKNFRVYRYHYLCEIFKTMSKDIDMESKIAEEIVRLNTPTRRVCIDEKCLAVYNVMKHKCDQCKCRCRVVKETEIDHIGDISTKLPKYFNVGECLNSNHVDITQCETIDDNPNSYKTVHKVMCSIYDNVIVTKRKVWVFVGASEHEPIENLFCCWEVFMFRCVGSRCTEFQNSPRSYGCLCYCF